MELPPAPPRPRPARRPYGTPQLRRYGALKDLTAGGSGTMQEIFMVLMSRFP